VIIPAFFVYNVLEELNADLDNLDCGISGFNPKNLFALEGLHPDIGKHIIPFAAFRSSTYLLWRGCTPTLENISFHLRRFGVQPLKNMLRRS